MSNIAETIAALSPERRKLLDLLLKKQNIDIAETLIVPQPRDQASLPLSFAQQRLWFLDQLEPGSPFYNIPTALHMRGSLDVTALERSLHEVVRRHEALRTSFHSVDGQPSQRISPQLCLAIPRIDLRALPAEFRMAEAQRLAAEEARRPFDLAQGPLLRASLLCLGEDEHVALLTMHHIVSDGWSMGVLVEELAVLYAAYSQGQLSPLPELAIQYADYAAWQRQWLNDARLEAQLDYWRTQLQGAKATLELPTDRPRPAIQSAHGGSTTEILPPELAAAMRRLGQQEGATLFMTLFAAFGVLLYRYSGQQDICVGTPIAGRTRSELEGLIGCFVNTLVLRAQLDGDLSLRTLLRQVRETTLGAYAHQDLPFETLVEALQPERDMSQTPLFQVMFILQNAPMRARELPGLTLGSLATHSGTATFDLTLSIAEGATPAEGLEAAIEYSSDLFDPATAERLLRHYRLLLEAIAANPDQPIAELRLLDDHERHQLLVEWNARTVAVRLDRCVHQLIEDQAAASPEAIAVEAGTDRLSYRELNARANRLANYLRRRGVGAGSLVAVCLDRSLDLPVAVLGVLKAGGAYVPLDPAYPGERLAFMLLDSQAPVLLTHSACRTDFPTQPAQTILLDREYDAIRGEPESNPTPISTADDLAYVVYTSGSTGLAKGVMVEHRSLLNAYYAWEEAYELRAEVRRHLQMASFTFDVFAGDLVRALCSGGTLVLCPRETLLEPRELCGLIQRAQIDCAEFVPAVLRGLFGWMEAQGKRLDSLRLLICGSDSWYVEEYRRLQQLCGPRTRLINSFGLTEATIDSSFFESVAPFGSEGQIVPIGRPFPNTQLYILDTRLQPVPIRVPGELYVGGAGLARGYLNRPELTAQRFIAHPFDRRPGARLYRTGDRARYLADGNIEFLGRGDDQVKIRGHRIEPGEVEGALAGHAAAQQVAVVARPGPGGEPCLVAYVVLKPGAGQAGELRRFALERLPAYMLPAAFVTLDALPLTPNGKIDRRALPTPDWSQRATDTDYRAPREGDEATLAAIWRQLLGLSQVSADDNFFACGGHSLLATQLVSRIREQLAVDLPLRSVFEAPTVAALAEQVALARRDAASIPAPPIRPVPRDGELPLSFAQQRLWFLDQLEPGSAFYNIPETLRLRGTLDLALLERSLSEIIQRHESLRTRFVTVDGRATQVIDLPRALRLALVDLQDLPPAERETAAQRRIDEETQQPFDLATGPLFRVSLLRIDERDHIVLLTIHHIISDDWSSGVLIGEIAALYEAFVAGRPSPLSPLPIQYADFAAWQREWLQGAVLDAQLAYWKNQLAGAPPLLELPTDYPRPAQQTFCGDYQTFVLPGPLLRSLEELGRQEGTTLFMTLLAAFQVLLYRYSGQQDICVGTPIAGRTRPELEGLIGFFVNTLVLRGDLSGQPSFRALLAQVRETALAAYAHQDLPFEMLVDALRLPRSLSYSPLFQVMFILQNAPLRTQNLPGLALSPIDTHSGTAKFDLSLALTEEDGELHGALEYNVDLFDRATIARMIGHFRVLLEAIVADARQPISTLPLLTTDERGLLASWNATATPYPAERCVHQLFEAQAATRPEATALVFEDRRLSYQELNRRTNRLAHWLRQRGVGPEMLVAICAEPSPELIIAGLAVLKAGGAFLPLDPSYPAERLAFMLEDARAPLLLLQHHLRGRLPDSKAQVIDIEAGEALAAVEPDTSPAGGATPTNLAYLIYTSGSTGRPKGVMLEHRGLSNLAAALLEIFAITPSSRVLQFAAFGFDAAVSEIMMALVGGATLYLARREILSSAPDLVQLLREQAITTVTMPPSLLAALPNDNLPHLHTVVSAGESCSWEVAERWSQGRRFLNGYGPTEATVGSSYYPVARRRNDTLTVPIGGPIANVRFAILDRNMQQVPVGVPGELHIGGAGLARGYLRRPELTAEKFIADPFTAGTRLYKTGDLARYRADGMVEFLGRIDQQVKLRGFRIELGEIETVLARHPGLREAVVVLREDTPGDRRLVAYSIAEGTPAPTVGELRAFLHESLPEYMLPAAFVTLEAWPLTPNGKVDRKALPAPGAERPELESAYSAPATPAEETLAAIWAELLGVDKVGRHDNFFELGGDSILGIQIIARAGQAGLRLTPRQLFQAPTVAGLAALAGTTRAVEAEQGLVTGSVPLTPIQRWFFAQELDEPWHWNQSLLLMVHEPIATLIGERRELLAELLECLLTHHDALRMRYQHDEYGWRQTSMGGEEPVPLEWIDLAALPASEQRAALEEHTARLQASLDLAAGPLLRLAYFDLGTRQPGRLLIIIHHLAVDGVSWRILLEDLHTLCRQLGEGAAPTLPPKTSSFQHWARRLEEYARSQELRDEAGYWLSALSGPRPRLPLDFPGAVNSVASARNVALALSPEETTALLRDVPAAYGTEINDVLLTALAQAICRWSGAPALLVNLEGHGRETLFEEIDLARTVGWFTSLFPLRLSLPGQVDPGAALKAVKEQLRAVPRRGIGYGLLRYLGPDELRAQLRALPEAEISFNYLGQTDGAAPADAPFGPAPEFAGAEQSPTGLRSHLIEINGSVSEGRLQMDLTYSTNLHRQVTLEALASNFGTALRSLIRHCQSPTAGGYTPSDFGLARLDQRNLDKVVAKLSRVKGNTVR